MRLLFHCWLLQCQTDPGKPDWENCCLSSTTVHHGAGQALGSLTRKTVFPFPQCLAVSGESCPRSYVYHFCDWPLQVRTGMRSQPGDVAVPPSSVTGHHRSGHFLKPCWRSRTPQFYDCTPKDSLGPRVLSQGSCATSSMAVLCPIFNKWSPQGLPGQGPYIHNFHGCAPLFPDWPLHVLTGPGKPVQRHQQLILAG